MTCSIVDRIISKHSLIRCCYIVTSILVIPLGLRWLLLMLKMMIGLRSSISLGVVFLSMVLSKTFLTSILSVSRVVHVTFIGLGVVVIYARHHLRVTFFDYLSSAVNRNLHIWNNCGCYCQTLWRFLLLDTVRRRCWLLLFWWMTTGRRW